MLFDGFTEQEILAISKVTGPKDNREKVEPGIYTIDFAALIRGEIKVAEDHEAKQPNAIPWQRIATLLLASVNAATRRKVVAQALGEEPAGAKALKEEAQQVVDELLEETTITRKGAVRTQLVAVRATEGALGMPVSPPKRVSAETARARSGKGSKRASGATR